MQMTPVTCQAIIRRFHLPRQVMYVLQAERFHISCHTEYDKASDSPRALSTWFDEGWLRTWLTLASNSFSCSSSQSEYQGRYQSAA
jgi:hypothetical protein